MVRCSWFNVRPSAIGDGLKMRPLLVTAGD
jgi:hypothetical protein